MQNIGRVRQSGSQAGKAVVVGRVRQDRQAGKTGRQARQAGKAARQVEGSHC